MSEALKEIGSVVVGGGKPVHIREIIIRGNFRIKSVSERFLMWFGNIEVDLNEENKLSISELNESLSTKAIVAKLGGEEIATIAPSAFCNLFSKNRLSKEHVNLIPMKDEEGVLRAVDIRWHGGGWNVFACSVGRARIRGVRVYRVFSRNSES